MNKKKKYIFDQHNYTFDYERTHFWFKSRNNLIFYLINKFQKDNKSLVDIGCGNGGTISFLSDKLKKTKILGIEPDGNGYLNSKKKNKLHKNVTIKKIPFHKINAQKKDIILLLDVLEHLTKKNVNKILKKIYSLMHTRSVFILSVPQHAFLWSIADILDGHYRRYDYSNLSNIIINKNLKIIYRQSFNFFLMPIFLLRNLYLKNNINSRAKEFRINRFLNFFFAFILKIEFFFIRIGLKFKFGSSLFLICKKK